MHCTRLRALAVQTGGEGDQQVMICPRCKTERKDADVHWGNGRRGRDPRGWENGQLFHWLCTTCMQWWFDPRAVKRAFAAYERALKKALAAGAEDAHDARLRLRDKAYALACRARRARAKAEGKEAGR